MRISRIDFNEPTVVVLGAGASRGASFVKDLAGTLPPLDSDFFTQAQRLSKAKPRALVTELVRHTVEIFGINFRLTMEGFLTHVEYLSNVFKDYKLRGRPRDNPYPQIREHFLQVIAAVLDESIGREPSCVFHEVLVDSLDAHDTILSFNYDWLIDEALRKRGHDKWNPRHGYGVDAYSRGKKGKGTAYWACQEPRNPRKQYPEPTLSLLKMHGSMTWFPVPADREPVKLQLRQRWWHQRGNLTFEIAPPEWNKPLRAGIYKHVWQKARAALKGVRSLVFIGYSLPQADLPAQALFMVDAARRGPAQSLHLLAIINPDRDARSRIRETLRNRIDSATRILTFDRFEDFASFLGMPR